VYHRPGDKGKTVAYIVPRKNSSDDRPLIGILSPSTPVLAEKRFIGPDLDNPVIPGSAAARASTPFEFEDEIVATTDPSDPTKVTELPPDPRKPGSGQRDYFELLRRLQLLAGKDMTFHVLRKDGSPTEPVKITVPPEFHNTLGGVMTMGEVTMVRKGSPAEKAGIQKTQLGKGKGNKELEGDYIEQVEVTEADGSTTRYTAEPGKAGVGSDKVKEVQLDPLRLPDQLRQWAQGLTDKKVVDPKRWKVKLVVKRQNPPPSGGGNRQFDKKTVELDWDNDWQFDRIEPYSKDSAQAIPELGLGYQVSAIVSAVDPAFGDLGDDGLRPKDVIKEINYKALTDDKGKEKEGDWEAIEPHQWAYASRLVQSPSVREVYLKVNRDGKEVSLTLTPKKMTDWPLAQRGLLLAQDKRLQKATDFFDAIGLGLRDTYDTVMELFIGLRSMATGGVSVKKSLGGPLLIGTIAYQYASIDFWEFLFFIGMISINLAVINFLPIPVLDGGHMVFLLYELVRGKPASENVRVGATYVGLLFILGLFVFVLYLDITRIFFRSG